MGVWKLLATKPSLTIQDAQIWISRLTLLGQATKKAMRDNLTNCPPTTGNNMINLIGHSLRRYLILEQPGEGGMTIVFKAYGTKLERDAVVKVIHVSQPARENDVPTGNDLFVPHSFLEK